jgi:hypothetical protein
MRTNGLRSNANSTCLGLWRLTADKISEIFGSRITKQLKGKLNTTLEKIEHGHHIFGAYWKHAFVKQYEKFCTFLRNEVCSNNLADFGLKKALEHLAAVRECLRSFQRRGATLRLAYLQTRRRSASYPDRRRDAGSRRTASSAARGAARPPP